MEAQFCDARPDIDCNDQGPRGDSGLGGPDSGGKGADAGARSTDSGHTGTDAGSQWTDGGTDGGSGPGTLGGDGGCPLDGGVLVLPLDEAPGAVAGYGLRPLRMDYCGPLITIRRSSDNATADVYPSNGSLPLSEIAAWAAGSTVYVSSWRDQSGNGNDISQSVSSQQPALTLNAYKNLPGVTFSYARQSYLSASFPWVIGNGNWSAQTVILGNTPTGWYQPIFVYGTSADSAGNNTDKAFDMLTEAASSFDFDVGYYGVNAPISSIATTPPAVFSGYYNGSNVVGIVNGVSFSNSFSDGGVTGMAFDVGGSPGQTNIWLNGTLGELIAYPRDVSSSISTLESNARAYYGF